jgi:hypothetical protein
LLCIQHTVANQATVDEVHANGSLLRPTHAT